MVLAEGRFIYIIIDISKNLAICYDRPMSFLITLFALFILFFSIIIHEIAHGSVAYALGDPTAKEAGRLTLNPLRHLDPFGSVVFPIFSFLITRGQGPIFGWAKPVPVNPYNFRDQKYGELKVSLAGPLTNFLMAIIFGLFIRFLILPPSWLIFFSIIAVYNFAWGIFNLVPIPPLDGSHILFTFLPEKLANWKMFLVQNSLLLLLLFIAFGPDWIFLGAMILYHLITGQPFVS